MSGRPLPPTETLRAETRDHVLVQQFRLRVLAGPDCDATYVSSGERAVVGTQPAVDFTLHDSAVSRFHCEIVLEQGRIVVRDLGSRNGTVVDGVAVLAAPLHDGAVLTLGRTQLRFELSPENVKIPLSDHQTFGLLVGRSPAMRAVFATLERAAQTDVTLLLHGETGTGKDAAAESVHLESARREGPFVVVDCGAIPPGLLESELFGYERGAFTGAESSRAGAFEAASGGTLFLDEVGELSLELQPKLLRVLEGKRVQRLGSTRRIQLDVRVLAATHRNLRQEVNARRFRSDLYYRLAVLEVTIAPLRERPTDLLPLVEHLLATMGAADQATVASLRTREFLEELERHSWPGNVRELRNYLERCLALRERVPLAPTAEDDEAASIDVTQPFREARERWLRSFERRYVTELLGRHQQNISAAARAAGIDRAHLHRVISRAKIRR
jgi:two-component system, NtrC family, response regulator GlrR